MFRFRFRRGREPARGTVRHGRGYERERAYGHGDECAYGYGDEYGCEPEAVRSGLHPRPGQGAQDGRSRP
ncbi:hypothetical protein GCM10010387_53530 [Streptomyces inusitatus]|uniref:Uncharacterized protein n=1 Tax=Streptomyces inusitatus TaxID=68221 RepID=A0A918QL75_9ACTN|nr:hypothetical protein GCM10010387_53530 [Streptomyces inusitatus]